MLDMGRKLTRAAIICIVATPVVASAQTAYVTDNLRLGLHRAEDTSDSAFRFLESGQQVEILTRNRNYAQVQLPDGTIGYAKVAYLVDDKPAKLIVRETQEENTELAKKLADLNAAFAQPASTIASLESELAGVRTELGTANETVSDLRSQNDTLQRRQSQYKYSVPITWVGGALAVILLVGFLGGLWWTDYQSRKRHGGIRIY